MTTALRHVIAIVLLPVLVTVAVPRWLTGALGSVDTRWNDGMWAAGVGPAIAVAFILSGLALFAWCVWLFARIGRGTLAPWDPTRQLVAQGPYRYVRNPMITGVALILTGEALWRGSIVLGCWSVAFILINHAYFIFSEEPGLAQRFGEPYRDYMSRVPRWLPRVRRIGSRSSSTAP